MADGGDHRARPDSVGLDALSSQHRDSIELNNEIAGRETGRAHRFMGADQTSALRTKEREREEAFNRLMHLLQDPEYAKLYNETKQTAERASNAVASALRDNALASDEAAERVREIENSAATLADGRKVFRAKDGRLVAEDGADVSDQRDRISGLSDKTSSWEDYQAAKARQEALLAEREAIERYRRDVLDPARERLNDSSNPYSKDELKKTDEELREQMPPSVRTTYERNAPAAPATTTAEKSAAERYMGVYNVPAPDVGTQFSTAHDAKTVERVAPLPDLTLKSTP